MSDNNKFISGLAFGALAGAALVLFLQSDKGKEILSSLKYEAETLRDQVSDASVNAEESLDIFLQKAKNLVADLEQKIHPKPSV